MNKRTGKGVKETVLNLEYLKVSQPKFGLDTS
jgi:hypothetical protein